MSGLRRARRLDFQQNKIVSREARPPRGPRERPALTRTHTRTRALTCTQQGTGVDSFHAIVFDAVAVFDDFFETASPEHGP